MRLFIKESYGDVELYKFVIYPIKKIEGLDNKHWDDNLSAYIYVEKYHYNIHTNETDDRYITHADIIDELVPFEVKRETHKQGSDNICGKTDCYMKDKDGNNPIRMWFSGDKTKLSKNQVDYLKKLFHADKVIR